MNRPLLTVIVAFAAVCVCAPAFAQSAAPKAVSSDPIVQLLQSGDAAQAREAVDQIRQALQAGGAERSKMVGKLQSGLLRKVLTAGLNDEAAELAQSGILAAPHITGAVVAFQEVRTRALLAAGKPPEALANAKSFYNVATMNKTADAMQLLADCLIAAHPDDPGIANRFRLEQLTGATTRPQVAPPPSDLRPPTSVLSSINVDPAPYEQAIATRGAGSARPNYNTFTAEGNLYLLADKPKEAKAAFEQAYPLARDANVTGATENFARAMKAEDGTIGRANSWVLSLRPKE